MIDTTTHTLDMENLTGQEYILAGDINTIFTPDFLQRFAKEDTVLYHYNQNEYASEFGYNLCTIY